MIKIYQVGGCVRDKFLGIKSKDIDFTFVLADTKKSVDEGFDEMESWMKSGGFEIFLSTKDCFTIRAKFPKTHKNAGLVADFVLARKEDGYYPGTRRPILSLGTLHDDLIRRDFTVNAMAEDEDGTLIDPFDGRQALTDKILDTPLDPEITFNDDGLRLLRSIRFSITKGLKMSPRVDAALRNKEYWEKMVSVVSSERIREELIKCFRFDTIKTLSIISELKIEKYLFTGGLWLKPTFEL